ncbi:hypothetical protein CANARDRAFT_199587 [[Candida] arabinofermentans NRRL YB-2248]|uniref:Uncharacterized protein n=1 Tax=[Candida] arabinofermentans NRRL YB-2248 TaxID=983967 RepID=A0A1E4SZK3_9ASCO|nr:hypothetical protein CANARDRAFT_199587 [[Candida] arabinofermentans NRRL YB-2248]
MVQTLHQKACLKHKKIIRAKIGSKAQQKNLHLVIYLNYLRFMNSVINKANDLSNQDGSSEVLVKHLEDAKLEMLRRFRG